MPSVRLASVQEKESAAANWVSVQIMTNRFLALLGTSTQMPNRCHAVVTAHEPQVELVVTLSEPPAGEPGVPDALLGARKATLVPRVGSTPLPPNALMKVAGAVSKVPEEFSCRTAIFSVLLALAFSFTWKRTVRPRNAAQSTPSSIWDIMILPVLVILLMVP